MRRIRRLLSARGRAESGITLIEVVIAVALISTTSVLAFRALTSGFNDSQYASQRLQAAQLLATELRTGGCGTSTSVTELDTTFSVTVTPMTCSSGATETGTATWTSRGLSHSMTMVSISASSSSATSAYAVTT